MTDAHDGMTYEYLLHSELQARIAFERDFATFSERMPEFLDTIFLMTNFMGQRKAEAEDGVHYFAVERCHRLPYALRASWMLIRVGYYAESVTIVRQVLESFVQIRYFMDRPNELKGHITAQGNRGRVQFKTMFERFSPGFYQEYYGRALSSISHVGIGFSVLSGMELLDDGSGLIAAPAGCKFNGKHASFSINHGLLLIAGFLNAFPAWFPDFSSLVDPQSDDRRRQTLDDLRVWRGRLAAEWPLTQDWLQKTEALMGL
jgi:hypothetical protein